MNDKPADNRDEQILEHIGRYTVSLRAVISKLFFAGKDPGNVLQRLIDTSQLQARSRAQSGKDGQSLPGGITYYQLTLVAARKRGFADYRTRSLNPRALEKALAILWFCCLNDRNRSRVELRDLPRSLAAHVPPGDYCMEKNPNGYRIYRLFVAGSHSKDGYWTNKLLGHTREAEASHHLEDLIRGHYYAVALIVHSRARRDKLVRDLKGIGLMTRIFYRVESVPPPDQLREALYGVRERQSANRDSAHSGG